MLASKDEMKLSKLLCLLMDIKDVAQLARETIITPMIIYGISWPQQE